MKRAAGVMGIALTSAWALLAACVGSDSEPIGSSGTGTDAASDAGPTAPAGSVLPRGGFEDLNCLGWTDNQATLQQDPAAQSGKTSCRVCSNHATSVWGIFQNVPSLPKGAYTVTAYAHASGDAGIPQHVGIQAVRLNDAGEQTSDLQQRTLDIAVNDPTWAKATFDFGVEEDGEPVSFGAVIEDTLDGCFLLDEFAVTPKK